MSTPPYPPVNPYPARKSPERALRAVLRRLPPSRHPQCIWRGYRPVQAILHVYAVAPDSPSFIDLLAFCAFQRANENGGLRLRDAVSPYIAGNPYGTRVCAHSSPIPCTESCIIMHYGWGYAVGGTHEGARGAGSHSPCTPPVPMPAQTHTPTHACPHARTHVRTRTSARTLPPACPCLPTPACSPPSPCVPPCWLRDGLAPLSAPPLPSPPSRPQTPPV